MSKFIHRDTLIENNKQVLAAQLAASPIVRAACSDDQREIQNGVATIIDTLTGIRSDVVTQKFYEVQPSNFMPVTVGENAWVDNILTYRENNISGDFEAGIIAKNSNDGRLERADTNITPFNAVTQTWAKTVNYNIAELMTAQTANNWSLIESKERSRAKNWQLGIQQVAFLGMASNQTEVQGLLTQTTATINTTVIPQNISDMNETEFQTFLRQVFAVYYSNTQSTTLPDTFIIPTDDYLGLGTAVSEQFPLKSRLERLKEAFVNMTGNADFAVLPLAYAQAERNSDFINIGTGNNRYVLYKRADEDSLRMDIPVDYTTTAQDTVNNFNYESVGYGQFTGVQLYRPREVLYFDHNN